MPGKPGFQTAAGFVGDIRSVVEAGKKAIASSKITDTTPTPIKCGLAVSMGDLTKETFEKLDEDMQIMLAGAIGGFRDLQKLSYNSVLADLMNNTLLEPMEDATVTRADTMIKTDTDWFKWDGKSLNSIQVKDVKSWFGRLIQNKEIIDDIQLDLAFFGKVVDYAKKTVNLFEASVTSKSYHENEMIKVAVLRCPDQEHPFLMLYMISLKAFRDGSRDVMIQEDTNGLTGEFHCVKFKPRTSVINSLSDAIKKKAVGQARGFVG